MPLAQNGQGGGGGSVLRGGGEVSTPLPPQNGEGDSLVSTLTEFGVFVLAPARLRATALALSAAEIDAGKVRELAAFIAGTEDDEGKQRKYLASVLSDVERAKAAIAGLEAHRRARAESTKPVDVGPPHMVNLPLGVSSCPCSACVQARAKQPPPEPWDHDRQCRIAHCLVVSDKRSRTEVAELLGVSETTLGVMLDRGRTLSTSALPIVKGRKPSEVRKMDDAEKERREQFHRMMREARMRKEMAL